MLFIIQEYNPKSKSNKYNKFLLKRDLLKIHFIAFK